MYGLRSPSLERRVVYVWSEDLERAANHLPSNIGRSSVVHDLVRSFDLLAAEDITQPERQGQSPKHPSKTRSADLDEDAAAQEAQALAAETDTDSESVEGKPTWPAGLAKVVPPDTNAFGHKDNLTRYHEAGYVGESLCIVEISAVSLLYNPTAKTRRVPPRPLVTRRGSVDERGRRYKLRLVYKRAATRQETESYPRPRACTSPLDLGGRLEEASAESRTALLSPFCRPTPGSWLLRHRLPVGLLLMGLLILPSAGTVGDITP